MQHHAADHLHIVMAHPQSAGAGLAHHGKRLRQQGVERFALRKTLPEAVGFLAQFLIAQFCDAGFQFVDGLYGSAILLEQAVIATTKDIF